MAFYGVGLEVKVKELLLQVKMQIQNNPGRGTIYLEVIFKRYNANGNRKLDPQELEKWFHLCKKVYAFLHLPFLFCSSHELKADNKRRCVPLEGRASNRAKQEVRRVVEFHTTVNHYFIVILMGQFPNLFIYKTYKLCFYWYYQS